MKELTEKQLVEKANLVLGMMVEGEGSRPAGVKFVGVNKERGVGGVSYELNSEEVANWIKEKAIIMMDFKEQMYKVVIDWIPVILEVNQPNSWRAILNRQVE